MKTYLIRYGVYFANTFESHETRIKNCTADWHAKARLGEYVARKYQSFERLEVYEIREETLPGWFTDIFK